MRDKRFIAVHRDGPLPLAHHRLLAIWAAKCAEHVLPLFVEVSSDNRPRLAIETARAWAHGEVRVGDAQKASVAAHGAARAAPSPSATAAARAAGHAVATAHMAEHSLGAAIYGCKAVVAHGRSAGRERAWQLKQVPASLRELVRSGLENKSTAAARKQLGAKAGSVTNSGRPKPRRCRR